MTERRQFCPKGHNTFERGRDASYRCLWCKRESGAASRRVRRDAEIVIRDAERLRQEEEVPPRMRSGSSSRTFRAWVLSSRSSAPVGVASSSPSTSASGRLTARAIAGRTRSFASAHEAG